MLADFVAELIQWGENMTSDEGNDDDSGDEDFNKGREQAYTNANTSLAEEDFSSDSNDDM